ncbi:MAG: ATPase, T2SS/T4P/T4SS family [Candidatus Omnitrophota bacterium]|nr:ATPase, T2SS/T4P/T4SS family [Candidatus Omnitrophota bacterium]
MTEILRGVNERLIDVLLAQKLLNQKDLDRVLQVQKEKHLSFSRLLVEMKLVDAKVLMGILSQVLQIPTISLSKMEMDKALTETVPRKLAFHYQMVPLSRLGQQLTIATANPLDVLATDLLTQVTGMNPVLLLATPDEIQDALQRLYGGAIIDTLSEIKGADEEAVLMELLAEKGQKPSSVESLIRLTQEGPVVKVTNALLKQGVHLKASDILIEPFEKKLRIRYRVDGIFREGQSPPPQMHEGIVSRIKVMANLNIAEHRLPQDGRIKFSVGSRDVDFRVSIIPTHHGEKVCLRILDKAQVMLDLDRLGFDPEALTALKTASARPHGMVLITGPTGSGKTTTMYSLLKLIDRVEKNLVTVEDPVEFDLPGVNQVSVRPEIGLTFAAGLRSILRQDPNIILIGEIRDPETADIAVKAALTGHLVLSTLHTNDALGAVARLVNMGVEPHLIAASLALAGAQRLPRKVCPACRETVHPSKEIMEQLGLPMDGTYVKGRGCNDCRNTGLNGRIGLLESVPMTSEMRRWIEQGASTIKLREVAHKAGFLSLREHAVSRAAAGIIPLEEVARTTVGYQE